MRIEKEVSLYFESFKDVEIFVNRLAVCFERPFINEEEFLQGKTQVIVNKFDGLSATLFHLYPINCSRPKKHDDTPAAHCYYVGCRGNGKSMGALMQLARTYLEHDERTIKQVINDIYGDHRPHPKFVMYNNKGKDNYTTIVWKDGSHTVVKCAAGDEYDEEKAVMFATIKHMCGDNGCEMGRYFEEFFDHEITHGDE